MEIVARAKGLLLAPLNEWRIIAGEGIDTTRVFTGYVMILAAIPTVAALLGGLLFGVRAIGIGSLLISAVIGYALALVSVLVLAKIVEFLAPKFGAPHDPAAALKLAAFAPTASWVAGGALLIPGLGALLALAGAIYSLYTFYIGAPTVARVPMDRMIPFAASVIGLAILVNIVIGVILTLFV